MQIHNNKEYSLPNNLKLIIYGRNSEHKHPKNAAVYYEDNTLKSWIEAPYFKSDKMIHGIKNEEHSRQGRDVWIIHPHKEKVKNFWGKVLEEKPQQGFLDAFKGMKITEGKEYAEMMISDSGMYFELQYLDLETCQFIKLVNWGGRF
ncbi:hypothetical protein [Aquimarina algiphila]|uniref:hypothetical protein n=1 Tax=Aquimarina algiphila TaxID=2047982 RepID=UPI002493536A|nr:hypothetical protein [Aquimarina algiphila]